jgi:hypothetical protein
VENAYIESFNGKFRDECLNEHWFGGLADARRIIEEWRVDYNEVRPHGSLEDLPQPSTRVGLRPFGRLRRPPVRKPRGSTLPPDSHNDWTRDGGRSVLKCGPRSWRTKVHTDLRQEAATK